MIKKVFFIFWCKIVPNRSLSDPAAVEGANPYFYVSKYCSFGAFPALEILFLYFFSNFPVPIIFVRKLGWYENNSAIIIITIIMKIIIIKMHKSA